MTGLTLTGALGSGAWVAFKVWIWWEALALVTEMADGRKLRMAAVTATGCVSAAVFWLVATGFGVVYAAGVVYVMEQLIFLAYAWWFAPHLFTWRFWREHGWREIALVAVRRQKVLFAWVAKKGRRLWKSSKACLCGHH
jgi:hypothetical protein